MPKLLTDAEAAKIRQRVAKASNEPDQLRTWIEQLLDDRDERRKLERKERS